MDNAIPSVNANEPAWNSLPARSLWPALHDACLVRMVSDPCAGRLTLTFRSCHLQRRFGMAEDAAFLFMFAGVLKVEARQAVPYPPFEYRGGESRAERSRREQEYHPVWRDESVGWPAFEGAVSEEASLDVSHATFSSGDDRCMLSLEGRYDSDAWTSVDVCAASLSVGRTNGKPLTLDGFLAMGEEYWTEFGSGRPGKSGL